MEDVNNSLEEVIKCIQNTKEYQKCIMLKEQMKDNLEITSLVKDVKKYQKQYIRSNYDKEIKETLDSLEKQLNDIPIYAIYLENLSKVNEMIEYVKESLNDYFYQLLNKKY